MEGLRKKRREHGHGQQRGDCRGGGGWVEMVEGIEGIKVDEKLNVITFFKKNK